MQQNIVRQCHKMVFQNAPQEVPKWNPSENASKIIMKFVWFLFSRKNFVKICIDQAWAFQSKKFLYNTIWNK